jgi:hypothetical protein
LLILELAGPPRCARKVASTWDDAGGRICVLTAGAVEGLLSSGDDPGRTRYYADLRHLLSTVAPQFDDCLIDAPALPDMRAVYAEALVDAVVSPIQVSPECIDCACEVINGTYGVRNVRARLNPALHFLGLLPVVDAPAAMEEAWAKVMETTLREWLIADRAFPHGYACLPLRTCVGRTGELAVRHRRTRAKDACVGGDFRTVAACLDVLTRRLDAVRTGAVPTVHRAEVCNA